LVKSFYLIAKYQLTSLGLISAPFYAVREDFRSVVHCREW